MNDGKIDPLLRDMIELVNGHDQLTFDVTFMMNGLIVSGLLISEKQYRESWKERVNAADSFSLIKGVRFHTSQERDSLEKRLEDFQEKAKELQKEWQPTGEYQYIHLKDAQVKLFESQAFEADFWRGRVDAVDGFVARSLRVLPPPKKT